MVPAAGYLGRKHRHHGVERNPSIQVIATPQETTLDPTWGRAIDVRGLPRCPADRWLFHFTAWRSQKVIADVSLPCHLTFCKCFSFSSTSSEGASGLPRSKKCLRFQQSWCQMLRPRLSRTFMIQPVAHASLPSSTFCLLTRSSAWTGDGKAMIRCQNLDDCSANWDSSLELCQFIRRLPALRTVESSWSTGACTFSGHHT